MAGYRVYRRIRPPGDAAWIDRSPAGWQLAAGGAGTGGAPIPWGTDALVDVEPLCGGWAVILALSLAFDSGFETPFLSADSAAVIADPSNRAQGDTDGDALGDRCDLDDGLVYLLPVECDYLEWQQEPDLGPWNVYSGDPDILPQTGLHTQPPGSNPLAMSHCALPQPVLFESPVPVAGRTAFYLAAGYSGLEEGGLGHTSAGDPRPNANPCP